MYRSQKELNPIFNLLVNINLLPPSVVISQYTFKRFSFFQKFSSVWYMIMFFIWVINPYFIKDIDIIIMTVIIRFLELSDVPLGPMSSCPRAPCFRSSPARFKGTTIFVTHEQFSQHLYILNCFRYIQLPIYHWLILSFSISP